MHVVFLGFFFGGGVVFVYVWVFFVVCFGFCAEILQETLSLLRGTPERCNFGLGVKVGREEINLFTHICLYLEQLRL